MNPKYFQIGPHSRTIFVISSARFVEDVHYESYKPIQPWMLDRKRAFLVANDPTVVILSL